MWTFNIVFNKIYKFRFAIQHKVITYILTVFKLLNSIQKVQFRDLAIPSSDRFPRNDDIDKNRSFANDIGSNLLETTTALPSTTYFHIDLLNNIHVPIVK